MNRLLARFYAWLLPIGPMRLSPAWSKPWPKGTMIYWEMVTADSYQVLDETGHLITVPVTPRDPTMPVPIVFINIGDK